jgi:hypothetical protein
MSGRARRATRPTACLFGALDRRRLRPPRPLTRSRRSCPADFAGASPWESPAVGRVYQCKEIRTVGNSELRRDSSADARDPPTSFAQGLNVLGRPAPKSRSIAVDRAKRLFGFSRLEFCLIGNFRIANFENFRFRICANRSAARQGDTGWPNRAIKSARAK